MSTETNDPTTANNSTETNTTSPTNNTDSVGDVNEATEITPDPPSITRTPRKNDETKNTIGPNIRERGRGRGRFSGNKHRRKFHHREDRDWNGFNDQFNYYWDLFHRQPLLPPQPTIVVVENPYTLPVKRHTHTPHHTINKSNESVTTESVITDAAMDRMLYVAMGSVLGILIYMLLQKRK